MRPPRERQPLSRGTLRVEEHSARLSKSGSQTGRARKVSKSVRTGIGRVDVWAVGVFADARADKTLIEHWDGTR